MRRRHTRWPRDWSSDVCSSDLKSLLLTGYIEFLLLIVCIEMICRNRHLFYHFEPKTIEPYPFDRVVGKKSQLANSQSMEDLSNYTVIPCIHYLTQTGAYLLLIY